MLDQAPGSCAPGTKGIPDTGRYMASVGQYIFDGRTWQADLVGTSRTSAAAISRTWRDVHLNGPEYGLDDPTAAASSFSQNNRGTYGIDYHYESQASLIFLASRGVRRVKIPVRWERINPVLFGGLDPAELSRLLACLDRCAAAGLKTIVDVHNYGLYYIDDPEVADSSGARRPIGSAAVPISAYANLWKRLASALHTNRAVVDGGGYALMAEPQGLGGLSRRVWQAASQAAVDAIRAVDGTTVVHVAGWDWSVCQGWWVVNGAPWIVDPGHNVKYECHHYWDQTTGGSYDKTYAEEVALARMSYSAGGYADALHNRILTELGVFATWVSHYGVRGIVGELSWPARESPTQWNALAEVYLRRCDELRLDTVFWSCGEWAYGGPADLLAYTGSPLSSRNAQAPVLEAHPPFG